MRSSVVLLLCLLGLGLVGCRASVDPDTNTPVVPEGFDETTLERMRCPENGSALRFARRVELAAINDRINSFKMKTWAGTEQTKQVDAVIRLLHPTTDEWRLNSTSVLRS